MIRTQIYLPEELHKDLKALARSQDKSVAELIRKSAKDLVKGEEKRNKDLSPQVFKLPKGKLDKPIPHPLNREVIYEL